MASVNGRFRLEIESEKLRFRATNSHRSNLIVALKALLPQSQCSLWADWMDGKVLCKAFQYVGPSEKCDHKPRHE